MFGTKKHLYAVENLISSPQHLKAALKKASHPRHAEVARNLGLYYLYHGQILSALSWFDIAINHNFLPAILDKGRMHIQHAGKTVKDFLQEVTFSRDVGVELVDKACRAGVKEAPGIKLRLLYQQKQVVTPEICRYAWMAMACEDDLARAILIQGTLEKVDGAQKAEHKTLPFQEMASYLVSLFPIGGETAFYCAKLMSFGPPGKPPYLSTPFVHKKAADYIEIAAHSGHPESMFLWGRKLILDDGDADKGETFLRKSLKHGTVVAGVFLADWFSRLKDRKHDAIALYRHCGSAPFNHLGAQCALVIHQMRGEPLGLSDAHCRAILHEGFQKGLPIATHAIKELEKMR